MSQLLAAVRVVEPRYFSDLTSLVSLNILIVAKTRLERLRHLVGEGDRRVSHLTMKREVLVTEG